MNHIAIVGLRFVGLPLALQFARSGAKVLGLDIDLKKNDAILEGRSYIKHVAGEFFYHDLYIPVIPMTREHAKYAGRKSEAEVTDGYDLIVLSTGHDEYKDHDFSGYGIPFVDTRNAIPEKNRPNKYWKA
ncbi:MAG: hypothetical protein ACSHX9_12515 [Luteolibacter sp.]